MLHRGIKFVHAALLAFSAVLAFLFVRGLDEGGVLGNAALVDVIDSNDMASSPHIVHSVEAFAAGHGVDVAREAPDLRNPDGIRHLYMAPANPHSMGADWLAGGYPAFSRNYETRVHPISEIAHEDPRGSYYVFGPPAAADALKSEFARLGMTASVTHPLSYRELSDRIPDDPLFRAFCVVALAALTMTGASVLLNAKAYGVLRMHGMSFGAVLLRDLRQLAVFWAVAAGAVAAATAALLGFYNGLAWPGLFAAVAGGAAALLTLVALAGHAAALGLTFKVAELRALKGELPSRAASVSVYLVRIPALLLALSIATNVTLAGRDVLTRQENRDRYSAAGAAVSLRLNGAFAMHMDQLDRHVGPWLRKADARGEVIVAGRRDLQMSAPGAHLPAGEFLIVNDLYLKKQTLLDRAGRRITAAGGAADPDSRSVRVVVPGSLSSHVPAIMKAARTILDPGLDRHLPMAEVAGRSGQTVFGYNSGAYVYNSAHGPDEDRSLLHDPVVIAVPSGSHFLTDDAYTTFATQTGVVFPRPADVFGALGRNGLSDYVNAVSPVGGKSALDLRTSVAALRLQVFNLLVSVLVLLVAGIGVCLIYARKNAQSIFARHIAGWRYVSTHRFVLAVEAGIAVVFATRVPLQAWQQNQEVRQLAAAGDPAPFEPLHIGLLDLAVITGLVVFELGAVLLALAWFHRRIVREGAAES